MHRVWGGLRLGSGFVQGPVVVPLYMVPVRVMLNGLMNMLSLRVGVPSSLLLLTLTDRALPATFVLVIERVPVELSFQAILEVAGSPC
jgi:hypothetical protein